LNQKKNIENKGFATKMDEHTLLQYLEGNMPAEEQYALEQTLDSDPFLNDALDGLSEIKKPEQLTSITVQINARLRHNIKKRQAQRYALKKTSYSWGIIFVLAVLLIIIICWIAIKTIIK
jgi:hypothetical protein